MMKEFELFAGEELHTLIENELYILQRKEHFRFGTDAVLLANWVKVRKTDKVIDLGTGSGIIPLLIAYKHSIEQIVGVEIQEEMALLAERSVRLNTLPIQIIHHDFRKIQELFKANTFSLVVSNPPYFPIHCGELNVNDAKALARHEITCNLGNLVEVAAYLLGSGGRFALIHRPERIPEIFTQLINHRLEPKRMCMIQPHVDKSPNLVLIEAVMDGRPGLKVEPGLIVYDQSGHYTPEVIQMYNGVGGERR